MKKRSLFRNKKNQYMSFTLLFGFMIVSFKFDENDYQWLWTEQIYIPIIFGIITILMGRLWFREYKKEVK